MKRWLVCILLALPLAAEPERRAYFSVFPPQAEVFIQGGADADERLGLANQEIVLKDAYFARSDRAILPLVIKDPSGRHLDYPLPVPVDTFQRGQLYRWPASGRHRLTPVGLAWITDLFWPPSWTTAVIVGVAAIGLAAYRSRKRLSHLDREQKQIEREIREVERATGVPLPVGKTHFDRIANFYVVRHIKDGGFGTVYLGCKVNDRSPAGLVALKRQKPLQLDPNDPDVKGLGPEERRNHLANLQREAERRFLRECKRHQELDHPNIVKLVDYGKDAEGLYLAMEYLSGTNFQDYLNQKGPLNPPEALGFFEQICNGLHAIHVQGITHRDIKPDNLILSGSSLKICDFGTARKEALDTTYMTIADDGQGPKIAGTLFFMAPEVMATFLLSQLPRDGLDGYLTREQQECYSRYTQVELLASPSIDQYAAGVTLYHMLTLKFPITGNEVYTPKTPIKPLTQYRTDLDPRLVEAVHRMLEKDPKQRYPSIREALKATQSTLTSVSTS